MADKLLKGESMKIRALQKIRNRLQGFSLTESLFGVAMLGTVFMSLYSGMANGFQSIRQSQENLRATQILLEKFETIRLYNWEQVNTDGFIPPTFTTTFAPTETSQGITYNGRVTIGNAGVTEAYNSDLRTVTLDLTWTSGRVTHHRTFTSFVARYGIQHYVY